ncbi:MAG: FKBP-type peptidyl-prolyl cis-trans isomerase [Novosphingobium sp.]
MIIASKAAVLAATLAMAQAAAPAPAPAPAPASPIIALPLNPVVASDKRGCTAKTASGLGYTVLRPGAAGAARPTMNDVVLINYIGYLAADGAVFDQAMQTPMGVADVIGGFGEGMTLAAKGSVVRLCIPSALGYGAQGTGPIPGNADLVFQVELIDFKSKAELEAMRKAAEAPAAK